MHDRGKLVAVVSIDLSNAFDVVQHHLLLAKLKAYGVGERSCALLKDYLTETTTSHVWRYFFQMEMREMRRSSRECDETYVL